MGFITTVAMVSVVGLIALRPPMPRHSSPWNLQFGLGFLINEQPFLGLYWLAAGTAATVADIDVGRLRWWLSIIALAVPVAVLTALAIRARSAAPALAAALHPALDDRSPKVVAPIRSRMPLVRVLFLPFISYRPAVRRFRNIRY